MRYAHAPDIVWPVGYRDEDQGERFEFAKTKAKLPLSIIDSIDQQHKGIVFYYTWAPCRLQATAGTRY
jgi:hypothetical protein